MSRFVRPEFTTLPISQGDTLTVRKRLSSGERRKSYGRMYLAGLDGQLHVNPFQSGMALITAYVIDWTLKDDSGNVFEIKDQPIEVVEAALDALDDESFEEIQTAVSTHEAAMIAERLEEKKAKDTASSSPKTSPLPSDAAGATNGSPD